MSKREFLVALILSVYTTATVTVLYRTQSEQYSMYSAYSGATLSGCFSHVSHGMYFWTAGQRVDPSSDSPFMWKMKSSNANVETLSAMEYTNWYPGQPDYRNDIQSCMIIWAGHSYTWDDSTCSHRFCAVCELDI